MTRMNHSRRIFNIVALALVHTAAAFSQAVNGTIVGMVTDASGGSIAGARVTLTEVNTRIVHFAETNSTGNYGFLEMPPGAYNISVETPGFKKEVKTGVLLEANTSPRVDMRMQPGDINQTVEVAASSAILQTERADTGRSISATTIEELPLGVNRNFQSLRDMRLSDDLRQRLRLIISDVAEFVLIIHFHQSCFCEW